MDYRYRRPGTASWASSHPPSAANRLTTSGPRTRAPGLTWPLPQGKLAHLYFWYLSFWAGHEKKVITTPDTKCHAAIVSVDSSPLGQSDVSV